MSSYNRIVIILSLFVCISFANENSYKKLHVKEDLYIVFALEYEKSSNFNASRELFLKLYTLTNKYEYLLKYLRTSLSLKKFKDVNKYASKNLKENEKEYEIVLRIYCISLLNTKEVNKAFLIASTLIKKFNNAINYELMANVYFVKEDFNNAKKYYESAYVMSKKPSNLFNLVNILYAYLDKKEQAISYLETYVRLYGCTSIVCNKLLSIYQEQNNIDGSISILKRSYFEFKEKKQNANAIKVYKLLIAYLEKKDIKEAIKFLEENPHDSYKLISLYKRTNQNKKALVLVKKLYEETGNIDLLAQIAILEFESAKNKEIVIKSVIKKFESVLVVLNNHVYQNYLAYILIDFEIDVKKGLALVKKALEQAPNNIAYLDSLAWGLYKDNKCSDAYSIMQKIVDEVGLSDNEIKHHWKKIKGCKK